MQRMVNQIDTAQDSPELKKQLHSIQHYTQQLVKDTRGYIKDLHELPVPPSQSEARQRRMQRERLQDEFTSTLNIFQAAQRSAAFKEKEQVRKVKDQVYAEAMSGECFLIKENCACNYLAPIQNRLILMINMLIKISKVIIYCINYEVLYIYEIIVLAVR